MFSRNKDAYTVQEQDILSKSLVVIFGCGGGGCVVAELLTRNGIGSLILIDGDKFETSNLNRQIAATQDSIGKIKVEELKNRLTSINPNINIKTLPIFAEEKKYELINNIIKKQLKPDMGFCVCDTADEIKNKIIVSNFCTKYNYQLVSGGDGVYNCWVGRFTNIQKFNTLEYFKNINTLNSSCNNICAAPCTVWNQGSLQALTIINSLLGRDVNGKNNYIITENLLSYTLLFEELK